MTAIKPPQKRGSKPTELVDLRVSVTTEQDAALNRMVRATGPSKAAIVRQAAAAYGIELGHLAPSAVRRTIPTRTRGCIAPRKDSNR